MDFHKINENIENNLKTIDSTVGDISDELFFQTISLIEIYFNTLVIEELSATVETLSMSCTTVSSTTMEAKKRLASNQEILNLEIFLSECNNQLNNLEIILENAKKISDKLFNIINTQLLPVGKTKKQFVNVFRGLVDKFKLKSDKDLQDMNKLFLKLLGFGKDSGVGVGFSRRRVKRRKMY